jgi:myosin heavy subunit
VVRRLLPPPACSPLPLARLTRAPRPRSINYANEKLQQFFLRCVFAAEEALYLGEGLAWARVEYQDNRGCLELLESSPNGLLRLLDEECKRPGGGDANFCEAAAAAHRSNGFLMEPRLAGHRQLRARDGFVVRHFAGDVCYRAEGFLDKNNDALHPDLLAAAAQATNPLLAQAFAPADAAAARRKGSGGGGGGGGGFSSVGRRFVADLAQLVEELGSTRALFLRCVKPNGAQRADAGFSAALVLQQLRCAGTVEAVQLMATGYPTRIPYSSLYERYAPQLPQLARIRIRGHEYPLEPRLFCETLARALGVQSGRYKLGATRLFLRAGSAAGPKRPPSCLRTAPQPPHWTT